MLGFLGTTVSRVELHIRRVSQRVRQHFFTPLRMHRLPSPPPLVFLIDLTILNPSPQVDRTVSARDETALRAAKVCSAIDRLAIYSPNGTEFAYKMMCSSNESLRFPPASPLQPVSKEALLTMRRSIGEQIARVLHLPPSHPQLSPLAIATQELIDTSGELSYDSFLDFEGFPDQERKMRFILFSRSPDTELEFMRFASYLDETSAPQALKYKLLIPNAKLLDLVWVDCSDGSVASSAFLTWLSSQDGRSVSLSSLVSDRRVLPARTAVSALLRPIDLPRNNVKADLIVHKNDSALSVGFKLCFRGRLSNLAMESFSVTNVILVARHFVKDAFKDEDMVHAESFLEPPRLLSPLKDSIDTEATLSGSLWAENFAGLMISLKRSRSYLAVEVFEMNQAKCVNMHYALISALTPLSASLKVVSASAIGKQADRMHAVDEPISFINAENCDHETICLNEPIGSLGDSFPVDSLSDWCVLDGGYATDGGFELDSRTVTQRIEFNDIGFQKRLREYVRHGVHIASLDRYQHSEITETSREDVLKSLSNHLEKNKRWRDGGLSLTVKNMPQGKVAPRTDSVSSSHGQDQDAALHFDALIIGRLAAQKPGTEMVGFNPDKNHALKYSGSGSVLSKPKKYAIEGEKDNPKTQFSAAVKQTPDDSPSNLLFDYYQKSSYNTYRKDQMSQIEPIDPLVVAPEQGISSLCENSLYAAKLPDENGEDTSLQIAKRPTLSVDRVKCFDTVVLSTHTLDIAKHDCSNQTKDFPSPKVETKSKTNPEAGILKPQSNEHFSLDASSHEEVARNPTPVPAETGKFVSDNIQHQLISSPLCTERSPLIKALHSDQQPCQNACDPALIIQSPVREQKKETLNALSGRNGHLEVEIVNDNVSTESNNPLKDISDSDLLLNSIYELGRSHADHDTKYSFEVNDKDASAENCKSPLTCLLEAAAIKSGASLERTCDRKLDKDIKESCDPLPNLHAVENGIDQPYSSSCDLGQTFDEPYVPKVKSDAALVTSDEDCFLGSNLRILSDAVSKVKTMIVEVSRDKDVKIKVRQCFDQLTVLSTILVQEGHRHDVRKAVKRRSKNVDPVVEKLQEALQDMKQGRNNDMSARFWSEIMKAFEHVLWLTAAATFATRKKNHRKRVKKIAKRVRMILTVTRISAGLGASQKDSAFFNECFSRLFSSMLKPFVPACDGAFHGHWLIELAEQFESTVAVPSPDQRVSTPVIGEFNSTQLERVDDRSRKRQRYEDTEAVFDVCESVRKLARKEMKDSDLTSDCEGPKSSHATLKELITKLKEKKVASSMVGHERFSSVENRMRAGNVHNPLAIKVNMKAVKQATRKKDEDERKRRMNALFENLRQKPSQSDDEVENGPEVNSFGRYDDDLKKNEGFGRFALDESSMVLEDEDLFNCVLPGDEREESVNDGLQRNQQFSSEIVLEDLSAGCGDMNYYLQEVGPTLAVRDFQNGKFPFKNVPELGGDEVAVPETP